MNGAAFASFVASGQTCVSGTRLIVQSEVYDLFMSRFLEKVQSITKRMGDRKWRGSICSSCPRCTDHDISDEPKLDDGNRDLDSPPQAHRRDGQGAQFWRAPRRRRTHDGRVRAGWIPVLERELLPPDGHRRRLDLRRNLDGGDIRPRRRREALPGEHGRTARIDPRQSCLRADLRSRLRSCLRSCLCLCFISMGLGCRVSRTALRWRTTANTGLGRASGLLICRGRTASRHS